MKYRRPRTTETTDAFSEFLAEHPGLWPRPNASGETTDPFNEFPAEPEPQEDRWLKVARGRQMTAKVHDYRHALAAASVFLSIFMPAGIISTVIVGRQLAVTPLFGHASVPSSPGSLVLASLETLPAAPAIDVTAAKIDLTAPPAAALTPRTGVATKPVLQPPARPTQRPEPESTPLTPQVSSPSNALPLTSAVLSSAASGSLKLPPSPVTATPAPPATTTVNAPAPRLDPLVSTSAPPSGPPVVPSAPPAAVPNTAAENSAVRAAIDRYRTAFSRLDAGSAKAVWPAVDERALSRAFNQMEEQQFVFDSCKIDVNGARATASCRGRAQYVPKVGSRSLRTDMRQWAFTLRRTDQDWTIESVDSR